MTIRLMGRTELNMGSLIVYLSKSPAALRSMHHRHDVPWPKELKRDTWTLRTMLTQWITPIMAGLILVAPVSAVELARQKVLPQATHPYIAILAATVAQQGQVNANGQSWMCRGTRCTIDGHWPMPGVGDCRALAQRVGPIRRYGHNTRLLSAAELNQCNAGIATAPALPSAAPTLSKNVQGVPQTPTTSKLTAPTPRGTTPPSVLARSAPANSNPGSGFAPRLGAPMRGHTINTAALVMSGQRHVPKIVDAPGLQFTGLRYQPQSINTSGLSMVGQRFPSLDNADSSLSLSGQRGDAVANSVALGREINTQSLIMHGVRFEPRTIATSALHMTGTGFTSIAIDTGGIRFNGSR